MCAGGGGASLRVVSPWPTYYTSGVQRRPRVSHSNSQRGNGPETMIFFSQLYSWVMLLFIHFKKSDEQVRKGDVKSYERCRNGQVRRILNKPSYVCVCPCAVLEKGGPQVWSRDATYAASQLSTQHTVTFSIIEGALRDEIIFIEPNEQFSPRERDGVWGLDRLIYCNRIFSLYQCSNASVITASHSAFHRHRVRPPSRHLDKLQLLESEKNFTGSGGEVNRSAAIGAIGSKGRSANLHFKGQSSAKQSRGKAD